MWGPAVLQPPARSELRYRTQKVLKKIHFIDPTRGNSTFTHSFFLKLRCSRVSRLTGTCVNIRGSAPCSRVPGKASKGVLAPLLPPTLWLETTTQLSDLQLNEALKAS